MVAHGTRTLRDRFDESPTPHIAHPPKTHHRDVYIATDGSYQDDGGGLGVIAETQDGRRFLRIARRDTVPNNNVAEYRALHLGLDVLAGEVPPTTSVGIILDHDALAANCNAEILSDRDPGRQGLHTISVPTAARFHWRGIRSRLGGFDAVRVAVIDGDENPAHALANDPTAVGGHEKASTHQLSPVGEPGSVPPPSRADRHTSD